jgi:copper chaperone CopZ
MKLFSTIFFSFLLSFSLHAEAKTTVKLKGMTCMGCAEEVEEALKATGKVAKVTANPKTGETTITLKEGARITNDEIRAALKDTRFSLEIAS